MPVVDKRTHLPINRPMLIVILSRASAKAHDPKPLFSILEPAKLSKLWNNDEGHTHTETIIAKVIVSSPTLGIWTYWNKRRAEKHIQIGFISAWRSWIWNQSIGTHEMQMLLNFSSIEGVDIVKIRNGLFSTSSSSRGIHFFSSKFSNTKLTFEYLSIHPKESLPFPTPPTPSPTKKRFGWYLDPSPPFIKTF